MTSDAWARKKESDDFLVDTYRLNSVIDTRGGRTVHKKIISDPSRGIRRVEHIETWSRLRELGRGGFGTVYVELLQHDGAEKLRAVKELRKAFNQNQGQEFLRELMHMAYFSKDQACFPQFQGWYEDEETIYLAMEYFQHGDLWQCVKTPLPEGEARHIIFQITEALEMLHSKDITHRDLKPENVFVFKKGPDWWVKLGDFGISKRVRGDETALYTKYLGPYIAPEVNEYLDLDEEDDTLGTYTSAVDIWSLGCVAYWLLTRQTPFHAPKSLGRYCNGKMALPVESLPSHLTSEGLGFVKDCLIVRPRERPSAHDALHSPWLKQVSSMAITPVSSAINQAEANPDLVKVSHKSPTELSPTQPGAADEEMDKRPSTSYEDDAISAIPRMTIEKSSLAQPKVGLEKAEELTSPTSLPEDLDVVSSCVERTSIHSMPEGSPAPSIESLQVEADQQEEEDDQLSETIKARPRPKRLYSLGPTITFTSLDSTVHSSIKFSMMCRCLPSPESVIPIGRYIETHEPAENIPDGPSDALVAFKSKVVSRKHCEVSYKDRQWYLTDIGSSSGTFLNHTRLSSPGIRSSPHVIKDGDRVQLGINFRGGEEEFYRCVRMQINLSGSHLFSSKAPFSSIDALIKAETSQSSSEPSSNDKSKHRHKRDEAINTVSPDSPQRHDLMDDEEIAKALSYLDEQHIPLESDAALHWAARKKNPGVLRYVLNVGGDANNGGPTIDFIRRLDSIEERSGINALHIVTLQDSSPAIQLLIDKGANIDATDDHDRATALHLAALHGHAGPAEILLEKGAYVEARTSDGLTPLHLAAQEGHLHVVLLLIQKGANASARSHSLSTPLSLASQRGQMSTVKHLIDKGAELDSYDSAGQTPLMLAIIEDHMWIAQHLIKKGGHVNFCDKSGHTPLIEAAAHGRISIIEDLLGAGADPEMHGLQAKTAIVVAKENGHKEAVKLLREMGAREPPHAFSNVFRSVFSKK